METFVLFAKPWWVNLPILAPIISFTVFRKRLAIGKSKLLIAAVFGVVFGFVEAAVSSLKGSHG